MLNLLRTPRWISFTAVLLVLIVAFGILSRWQWSRAEQHRLERIAIDERANAAPVPVESVVRPEQPLPADLEWRPVTAEGAFVGDSVLVRKRPLDGQNGFWVMTALQTSSGDCLWVNRGWTPTTGNATKSPDVAPPPAGPVSVTGRLRPSESGPNPQPTDLPTGQVTDADISVLPSTGDPTYDTYIELTDSSPNAQAGLTALAPPEIDDSRNISYAVQWILFAAVGIAGWFFFLRREARTDADEQQTQPN